MELWKSVVLGVVEGLTEFLPVSSTGHLTVAEKILDLPVDDASVTAYTAVIQVGATVAAIIYFFKDIVRIVKGFFLGLFSKRHRGFDYRFGWYVIVGSVPIAVVGVVAQDAITGPLRNLWVVAAALILWSGVMVYAERVGTQTRTERQTNLTDAVVVGVMQSAALFPGVSRSGATISFGLLRDLDRVTATRLSFFLGIPALLGGGALELKDALTGPSVGGAALAVGTVVSFIVGYASIAWLLRFVAKYGLISFVWYRVLLGVALIIALATGALAAT
ncbi:undecaprenyl-diphosphate phosphatase [Rugosimonospora acidiphila]|uniref:Undecaprenyl-diphosphatase n=1 Tax=Rugosimonospora acidiphila TaxID=556531 RepID=A0ABP9SJJ4_9ACTN